MKITPKIYELLREAYRRNTADFQKFEQPLLKRWLGLGTEAEYRPAIKASLMRFHNDKTPAPRYMGWLVLTENGVDELLKLAHEFHEQQEKTKNP